MTARVKICCIQSIEEARLAVAAGASALGLVAEMPSGPGVIDEDRITGIARWTPPGVASVLLTSERTVAAIIDQQRRLGVSTLQLVDTLTDGSHRELREALPGIGIIQVVHVVGEESVEEARGLQGEVDALLLDSGNPDGPVKELGGTGRVHDWGLSARIVSATTCPVFLAGGLTPDNAVQAIRQVAPYGLDLCSGVRENHRLQADHLHRFMEAVRGAARTGISAAASPG